LYLGGGTPSRLGGEGVQKLFDVLRERMELESSAEVTLEANPEDVTVDAVQRWREAGVNRLSIGAQSFDDEVLRWMHRTHDAAAISRAVSEARSGGIDELSLDLIFAMPEGVSRSWERDVELALELKLPHLSLYGLTIEPYTPVGRWHARGAISEAPEERYEREFIGAHDTLVAAGMEHYEVSSFAYPGHRAVHNSAYWTGVPYAGLGPSAHELQVNGMLGEIRRWNARSYVDWLARLESGEDPVEGTEPLNEQNRLTEGVYLGLRTNGGLRLTGAELSRVRPWLAAGWGTVTEDGRLVLTPSGWLRLDSLAADLTLVRSR
jgi:oxygen-independent coproporphyrinogen-3 oxidase